MENNETTQCTPSDPELMSYRLTGECHPYPYLGIGSQYNQGLYSQLTGYAYGHNETNYAKVEQLVKEMASQHIRVFYDSTPARLGTGVNPYQYTLDTPDRDSFRRVIKLAQETPGSTVNITFWHGPYTYPTNNIKGTTDLKVPFTCPQLEEFANELYYLIVTKGYTCVQYVTIQNEVDTAGTTHERYQMHYRSLVYYLEKKGIRDKIKFIGGDLAGSSIEDRKGWLDYMGTEMNDVIDGYSLHQYWHFEDNLINSNLQSRLINLSKLITHMTQTMPEEQRKPIYITEYGVKGYKVGINDYHITDPNNANSTPVIELAKSAAQIAFYQLYALNSGVVGLVRWDAFRAKYDGGKQDFSAIGTAFENFKLRPVYDQHQLLSAAALPYSYILKLQSESDDKLYQTVALRAKNGHLTILMSHRMDKTVSMVIEKMISGKPFYLYYWNEKGDGRNTDKGTVFADKDGRLTISVGAEVMAVVTEVPLSIAV